MFSICISTAFGQLDHKFKSWKHNDYIVTATILNVRDAPNESSAIIDQITMGTKVLAFIETVPINVEKKPITFCEVSYNDGMETKKGFVSTSYLSQFFLYDNDELIFIKKVSTGSFQYKMKVFATNNGNIDEIGEFITSRFKGFNIEVRKSKKLSYVRRIIEIEYEDDDSCSSGHAFLTYIEMEDGTIAELPWHGYQITEPGEKITDLQLPEDPYGSANSLTIIDISFTNIDYIPKIKDVAIKHKYTWDGIEWISE